MLQEKESSPYPLELLRRVTQSGSQLTLPCPYCVKEEGSFVQNQVVALLCSGEGLSVGEGQNIDPGTYWNRGLGYSVL